MRIAICDDNLSIAPEIEELIDTLFLGLELEYECDVFFSGEELIKNLHPSYQIYLLDIEMITLTGVDVAKKIREEDDEAIIIFMTSHETYTFEAFDVNAFHYLLKPINHQKLITVLKKAIHILTKKTQFFTYKKNKKIHAIALQDIFYFESKGRRILIYTQNLLHSFNASMKEVLDSLTGDFVRIHNSYIVNLNYVELVQKDKLYIKNGDIVTISRTYKKEFNKIYRHFVLGRMG